MNKHARLVSADQLRFALAESEPRLQLNPELLDRCPTLSLHVILPEAPTPNVHLDWDESDRWLLAKLLLDVDEAKPLVVVIAIQQSALWGFLPLGVGAHRMSQLLRGATSFLADCLVAEADALLAAVNRELFSVTAEAPANESAPGTDGS